jgi:predicted DNA-binding protein (UPF0251 family)
MERGGDMSHDTAQKDEGSLYGTPPARIWIKNFGEALKSLPAERRESLFRETLKSLSEKQREAIILTDVSGFSYAEAAQISGCDVKIFRKRVRSGRRRVAKILLSDMANQTVHIYIDEAAGIKVIGPTKDDEPHPPRLAEFLLTLFVPPSRADAMVGDLNERLASECKKLGRHRAVRLYWAHTLRSLWPLLRRAIGKALKWGVVVATVKRFF